MRLTRTLLVAALLLSPAALFAQTATAPTANDVAATIKPDVAQPPVSDAKPTFRIVNVEDGKATVPAGSLIGDLLMWASLLLGLPLAAYIVKWIVVFEKKLGVDVSDANRARLQEFVEHGIALGASRAQADLKDKLPIDVKSKVAIDALQYVQDHGTDTLKAMGIQNPTDPKVMEALQARIAKAMADKLPAPATPKA